VNTSSKSFSSGPVERISFVYPPYGPVKNEPGLRAVKENYGVFPPLSLTYAAAVADREGVEVQIVDANALGLSLDETIREVKSFNPDMLGFTVTTYLFHEVLAWVSALREAVGVPTLLGGVHMGIYPTETFSHSCIDFGCIGEAEVVVPPFLKTYGRREDLSSVKGLIWRDGDRVVVNELAPVLEDINLAPVPIRHLLPNDLYYSFISQLRNFAPMITSRGCPFNCIFCEQGGQKFRPRDTKLVVDEIEECIERYGVREIDFFDSNFTLDKQRVIDICEEILRRGVHINWSVRSRIDMVNEEMLSAMSRAGCKRIYYGIESGDEEILKTMRKQITLPLVRDVIAKTKAVKINTFGFFMIGCPGDTFETIQNTYRFAIDLKLDYAQFSKVTPMPATELYRRLVERDKRDYWREIILDANKEKYLPRPGTELTEEEIQQLCRRAYLAFYFRPLFILKRLLSIKSWHEFKRAAFAAWSMLIQRDPGSPE
jgi:radical SAM superfamily enzyme YgiQ (UPF0313 family)